MYDRALRAETLVYSDVRQGKKAAAEVLIKSRLEAEPNNPKLYNAMGDLTKSSAWYEKAWAVSEHRDARSQRSLARSALSLKEYARAIPHFKLALDRNPLNAESWFSLGFCHLKLDDATSAMQAFTRCVQLEPDNGEAWNNIGILHLQAQRYKPAKCALGVALKHKPQNWQICDNFSLAAAKSGEPIAAAHAMLQTLELSRGQRVHADVLELLVQAVSQGRGREPACPDDAPLNEPAANSSAESELASNDSEYKELALLESLAALAAIEDADDEDPNGTVPASESAATHGTQSGQDVSLGNDSQVGLRSERGGAADASSSGADWAADAAARQRGLLESAVEKCLKGAVSVESPAAAAWRLMSRFCSVTGDPRRARDAAVACFRLLQSPGWQNDPACVMAVAECAQGLVSLSRELLAIVSDVAEKRKDVASTRLQIASASKVALQTLGNDPAVVALQDAAVQMQALQNELKPNALAPVAEAR